MATNSQMKAGLIGGGIGSMMNGFFGGDDAFDQYSQHMQQGQDQIGQYLDQAEGYLNPYRQAGQQGVNQWQSWLDRMANPDYYNNMQSGYAMTPGAQFRLKTGMEAVQNAMASQGWSGSGNEGRALTDYTQGVINQDLNQYMQNRMGIDDRVLGGYGNLAGMGFNAANASGNYAMNAGQDIASMQAAMANAASQQANANQNNMWGGMGAIAGALML